MSPSNYNLEWLNVLILSTAPITEGSKTNHPKSIQSVLSAASQQKDQWQTQLKDMLLGIENKQQLHLIASQYHSELILALEKTYQHHILLSGQLQVFSAKVLSIIQELLSFLEQRYLPLEDFQQRLPLSYLFVRSRQLLARADNIKIMLGKKLQDKTLRDIVISTLCWFTSPKPDQNFTGKHLSYMKQLIEKIETILPLNNTKEFTQQLNQVLFYLNFNKKAYINYYTKKVSEKLAALDSEEQKLNALHLAYKQFGQMHIKSGLSLNPNYDSLKIAVGNWFTHEIAYLEKHRQLNFPSTSGIFQGDGKKSSVNKISLAINADQIAILLRAACDSQLINSPHLSSIFRTLVPFLSTANKKQLSWQSVRKNAYAIEDNNKKIVIGILKNMSDAIEKYS